MDSHYNDDISYRQCLRKIFEMNEKVPHLEIDDITNDENNYDEESMSKCMDVIYEKTRNHILFQNLYQHGAAKMFSLDQEIGLAVLCSYDYFHLYFSCLWFYFHGGRTSLVGSSEYEQLLNRVK